MTQSPNPFSREGSSGDGLGSAAGSSGGSSAGQPTPPPSQPPATGPAPAEPAANAWPSYPTSFEQPPPNPPAASPYGYSAGDIGSYGGGRTSAQSAGDSGFVSPTSKPVQAYPTYGTNPYGAQPYGASPYGASPYGASPYGGYGYAIAPPNHPQAIVAFVVSLVSLLMCQPVGIIGFVLGAKARRQIDANPTAYSGRGLATAGWVLGIVCIVTTVLGVLGLLLIVVSS